MEVGEICGSSCAGRRRWCLMVGGWRVSDRVEVGREAGWHEKSEMSDEKAQRGLV